jgi:hypothetical protein
MKFVNVEAGVLRSLKAYKVAQGMADGAATAWATANLAAGVAQVNGVLATNKRDPEGGVTAAFVALKAWAQS